MPTPDYTKGYEDASKAFGGCTLCYGKGYATVDALWVGGGLMQKAASIRFCECDRGKQLQEIISNQ